MTTSLQRLRTWQRRHGATVAVGEFPQTGQFGLHPRLGDQQHAQLACGRATRATRDLRLRHRQIIAQLAGHLPSGTSRRREPGCAMLAPMAFIGVQRMSRTRRAASPAFTSDIADRRTSEASYFEGYTGDAGQYGSCTSALLAASKR